MFEDVFKYKSVNFKKLIDFGFVPEKDKYVFCTEIMKGTFNLFVYVSKNGTINSKLIDKNSGEEYVLHLIKGAEGEFVGLVRSEVEKVLNSISENCFETEIFKSSQAKAVIEYIQKNYGDQLEFLWESSPDIAIARRQDNKKWYFIIFVLSKKKLGLPSEEFADIIDLRTEPEFLAENVDNERIFAGYHMNKKHWLTIILDGTFSNDEVFAFIDKSYELAKKDKNKVGKKNAKN